MSTPTSASVAAIQMVSTRDLAANLRDAARLLSEAAAQGARVAVLPENFAVLSTSDMLACGRTEAGDAPVIRRFLSDRARALGLWIVGGSLPLAARPDGSDIEDRVRASCLVFDDQGREVGRYDKIHLFDARVDDAHGHYRESDTFEPGDQVVTLDTPVGRLGLAICYDLRFPELFRALRAQGAEWVCLPSAFTWQTGDAHWHALIRARAIENQIWVVAAGQGGQNSERRRTYGHTLICDPWGKVVAEQAEGPGVVVAGLDRERLAQVRTNMPVWDHRRL
ncbi:carbon-nitrogen hydrolase [Marinobacter lutaoensis]|uniref:Carbon-nitrogen hydrolase n=1 Tax=Marinobacter lutaoensis TaxID=135739 RepID=A0A1V2DW37_9GAMM|nr:carbon-nitrogen hydrolase family protein [Marinobacter lutaoensis]ONF44984.1 carbon-nitrogen hydrolase [Marinobacter lutaoensis]